MSKARVRVRGWGQTSTARKAKVQGTQLQACQSLRIPRARKVPDSEVPKEEEGRLPLQEVNSKSAIQRRQTVTLLQS